MTQYLQDAQIFKERCEDSPGVLVLCQGDWRPTPERLRLFEAQNYYVLTAANGFQDIVDWLPLPRCIGGMFAHPETVASARASFPDKVIERFEGVGSRFLRSLTQELPYSLHNAGLPFTATTPPQCKTVDVVSVFSPVALKRGHLLIESLLAANVTAYVFAQSMGSNPELLASFLSTVRNSGRQIEYIHYPFDPYALIRIDGRIVIDGRPIGANNSIVSAYLARARLFVHTSTTEGISNSVMEALMNDVPVLICDDIRGPLQGLSKQLSQCIFRAAPETADLVAHIANLLAKPKPTGAVRTAFRSVIDPFEINRQVVRGVQAWFERRALPWKGHCLGLLGGVQSKLNLANVGAEESYRGGWHIYPSAADATQCVTFQRQVAQVTGRADHDASLLLEFQFIQNLMTPKMPQADVATLTSKDMALHRRLADLAEHAHLRQVLVIGAAANQRWRALVVQLGQNRSKPQVHCLESSMSSHKSLARQFADRPEIHCHHASSVPLSAFPTEEMVANFHQYKPDKLKDYPLELVLQWLRDDIVEMTTEVIAADGIRQVLQATGGAPFDLVVIDGREFVGLAELQQVQGAHIVLLGCTRTFKNQRSMELLALDENYELLFSEPEVGNGFAGFVHKEFKRHGGLVPVA